MKTTTYGIVDIRHTHKPTFQELQKILKMYNLLYSKVATCPKYTQNIFKLPTSQIFAEGRALPHLFFLKISTILVFSPPL